MGKLDQLNLFDDQQTSTVLDAEKRLEGYRTQAVKAGFRRACLPAWAASQQPRIRTDVWRLLAIVKPGNARIAERARMVLS